jgi:hypothetical protein
LYRLRREIQKALVGEVVRVHVCVREREERALCERGQLRKDTLQQKENIFAKAFSPLVWDMSRW